jgi:ABC-type glycerol-3-phosphate transport system permease component
MKRTNRMTWWYGGSLLAVLFTLLPLYLMVKVSVSPSAEVFTPHPAFAIRQVTGEHWKAVFTAGTVQRPLSRSLAVATWTMLGAIGLAAPAAYVMSRLPQPMSRNLRCMVCNRRGHGMSCWRWPNGSRQKKGLAG